MKTEIFEIFSKFWNLMKILKSYEKFEFVWNFWNFKIYWNTGIWNFWILEILKFKKKWYEDFDWIFFLKNVLADWMKTNGKHLGLKIVHIWKTKVKVSQYEINQAKSESIWLFGAGYQD